MAKKQAKSRPEEAASERKMVQLPIVWQSPQDLKAAFANHMIVQSDEHETHLSFYEIVPPLIVGDNPEERKAQVESLTSIGANLVARVVIASERLQLFSDALANSARKYQASKASREQRDGKAE